MAYIINAQKLKGYSLFLSWLHLFFSSALLLAAEGERGVDYASIHDWNNDVTIQLAIGEVEPIKLIIDLKKIESLSSIETRKWEKYLKDNPEIKGGQYVQPIQSRYTVEFNNKVTGTVDILSFNEEGKLLGASGTKKNLMKVEIWFKELLVRIQRFGKGKSREENEDEK